MLIELDASGLGLDCCKTFIAVCCNSNDSSIQTTRRHSHDTAVSLDTALKKTQVRLFQEDRKSGL